RSLAIAHAKAIGLDSSSELGEVAVRAGTMNRHPVAQIVPDAEILGGDALDEELSEDECERQRRGQEQPPRDPLCAGSHRALRSPDPSWACAPTVSGQRQSGARTQGAIALPNRAAPASVKWTMSVIIALASSPNRSRRSASRIFPAAA